VQQGQVEVFLIRGEKEIPLSVLNVGDTFGEMSLLSRQPRSASVRARGRARVLTVDKRGFLKRVQEDPSLAFRVLRQLSERVRELDEEVARLRP